MVAEFVSRLTTDFERPGLPAMVLTTDSSILTAHANDFDFDDVFAPGAGAGAHERRAPRHQHQRIVRERRARRRGRTRRRHGSHHARRRGGYRSTRGCDDLHPLGGDGTYPEVSFGRRAHQQSPGGTEPVHR